MSLFTPCPNQVTALVDAFPLAWVVSGGGEYGFAATPLPLLGERDEEGAVVALFGHFARANPQVAALERAPAATILFTGPQGYISPDLVSNPGWGATWNYAVARFDVDVRFVPDETASAVERLAAALEAGKPAPWAPDRMGARYDQLLPHIVAFRARVRATHARFKLGQDEGLATFDEIVAGLDDSELAHWMRASAPSRDG